MNTSNADKNVEKEGPEELLDFALTSVPAPASLVAIGREGRLTRETASGWVRVELAAVDETALALVDLALERRRNITIVYPAPAGEVSVLLAAQIVFRRLVQGRASQTVGIVTSDATRASKTWDELAIRSAGSKTPICEAFPVFRAGPDGSSPCGRYFDRGVIIGSRFDKWPVDVVVIDHLAGLVTAEPDVPTIRVFADPLDPKLDQLASTGELIWGWTESNLAMLVDG